MLKKIEKISLVGSNHPCLELIFMVPKVFEPMKFDCTTMKNIDFCTVQLKVHRRRKVLNIGVGGQGSEYWGGGGGGGQVGANFSLAVN